MRTPTRREFLGTSALAASTLARADDQKPVSANESLTLGFIGVGGMGTGLLNIFKNMPDVKVAALCDVYEPHLSRAKQAVGGKADTYVDFRRVLDRKDIDAVVIATPDHWHAIPAIMACQAGKDVYCEKPLAYRISESRAMVEAANKYKRVTQMGNLIHAGENYHRVVEIVRSGVLGTIMKTRVFMAGDRAPIGSPGDSAPPPGLDYDLWLGSAPKRPFNPNRFTFNWRYFWDYGGGYLTDFVCHIVDLVHWAMEVEAPNTISATGGRYVTKDNAETPDTLEVIYNYKRGDQDFSMIWSQTDRSSYGPEKKGMGIIFQGTNATLIADYNSFKIVEEKGRTIELPEKSLPRSVGHHREFLNAIKTRGKTSCHWEYGHRLSSVGHLGNIALWTGETLKWDAKNERVINHPEANVHLARPEYRAPWSIPKV
jgi:predicted dehydrogenase